MSTTNQTREQLEADANLLRERIAQNLESLDQRTHEAFDVKTQAVQHALPLGVIGAGSLLALLGSAGALLYRARHRASRFEELGKALKRVWAHPERIASSHPDPIGTDIARGVAVSIGTFVATQLAKRALHHFLPDLWREPELVKAR